MGRLEELKEQRRYECRLTSDRALESLDDAEGFLRDRRLATRTPDSSLPSLFEAFHEAPYAPGKGGFAEWPATKWRWPAALLERDGVSALKIHRGKTLFVTDDVVALVDPICRAEIRCSPSPRRAAGSMTCLSRACTQRSSLRSASCAAGSRGGGSSTPTSSSCWSRTAGSSGWT